MARTGAALAADQGEVRAAASFVPGLDGVRALAVGAVFLLHLARRQFPGGAIGVDVFFALSAFLITRILLEEASSSAGWPRPSDFYWRRAFRLLPALLLWLSLIAFPTAVLLHTSGRMIAWSTFGSLFFVNDFLEATGHVAGAYDQSWSLGVEEQFYLVWPVLLLLGIRSMRKPVQRAIFPLLAAVGAALLFRGGNYFLPTGHLLPLVLGGWAAWARHQGWRPAWLESRLAGAVGGAGAAFLALSVFWLPSGQLESINVVVTAVAAVALILSIDGARSTRLARVFGASIPRWVGSRSYGIYLFGLTAIPLVQIVTQLRLRFAAPAIVIVTVVVAELSYRFVEAPLRKAGREWLRDRQAQAAVAQTATAAPTQFRL